MMKREDLILILYIIFASIRLVDSKSVSNISKRPQLTVHYSVPNDNTTLRHDGLKIFEELFEDVSTPFIVCTWIIITSIAKVAFHYFENISASLPESCLLILLGIPIGFVLESVGVTGHLFLTSTLFFHYLLPPIIFDAGYFIDSELFFGNIGAILLYAVIGTIFNTFAVGASLFGVSGVCGLSISLLRSFIFGALISAVDPVAVLTVFEEVQVHEGLYMLVFGESVLNDAASVVLYRTFENLPDKVDAKQIGLAIASFLVVSIFGTLIGVIFGLITAFVTRFTDHVRVIEPLFVFIFAYMAYLTAEIFRFSGIMSILFCGLVMRPYVEANVGTRSYITIKYFSKMISSSCESVIFMFLGVSLVQYSHEFNLKYVAFTIFFISLFRVIGIVSLTSLANRYRVDKVSRVEQFIMSYGGLRGAVAFCLVILVTTDGSAESVTLKKHLVTTTLAVIIFTCFFQGGTIKILVHKLKVELTQPRELTILETMNYKVMHHMAAGIEFIIGSHGYYFYRELMLHFNKKYLRPLLLRHPKEFHAIHGHKRDRESRISVYEMSSGYGFGYENRGYAESDIDNSESTEQLDKQLINPSYNTLTTYNRDIETVDVDTCEIFPERKKVKKRRKYADSLIEEDYRVMHSEGEQHQEAQTTRDRHSRSSRTSRSSISIGCHRITSIQEKIEDKIDENSSSAKMNQLPPWMRKNAIQEDHQNEPGEDIEMVELNEPSKKEEKDESRAASWMKNIVHKTLSKDVLMTSVMPIGLSSEIVTTLARSHDPSSNYINSTQDITIGVGEDNLPQKCRSHSVDSAESNTSSKRD